MIIDTTYLLPLAKIGIDTDLLRAVDDGKTKLSIENVKISLISIFELQAKAAKLKVPAKFTIEATDVISTAFKVEPFYNPEIIEIGQALLGKLNDYIDCLIVATAVSLKEDLITEDSRIMKNRHYIKEKYKVDVLNYKEVLGRKGK
ncbi:MAG: PIN domain-containing protein [Candidatus Micrarchaeota archaeon]|nr:PIN domain-containing protein [Candidatus Micrarchaeota archaeon]